MKEITKFKSRSVKATSCEEFDRKFNEASDELSEDVELVWDASPMCVHFVYKQKELIPETIADEFELKGIRYYCKDCPNMLRGKNKREKSHGCKYAEFGTVTDFTPACDYFLRELKTGRLEPVDD